ncbi:hypothetical protein KIN20_030375, partial [Parelaphostrongylus tenuis]
RAMIGTRRCERERCALFVPETVHMVVKEITCSRLKLTHNYMRDLICYLLPMDINPLNSCVIYLLHSMVAVPTGRSMMKVMTAWKTMHLSQILGDVSQLFIEDQLLRVRARVRLCLTQAGKGSRRDLALGRPLFCILLVVEGRALQEDDEMSIEVVVGGHKNR